jgi:hypothetical protein
VPTPSISSPPLARPYSSLFSQYDGSGGSAAAMASTLAPSLPPPPPPDPEWAWQTFYLSVVCLVGILGNLLVAFTLLRRKQLKYPSNRFD